MSRVTCYQGNEPYIFISYSHKDSDKVLRIINNLNEAGFRCWYDDGIDPGSEWDENIARHLGECGFFVAFISDNYIRSENCKDELNYVRELNKPRLLVYLEDCTLPDGMFMRLNRLQAIHYYTYSNEEEAMAKIFSTKQIDICQEKDFPTVTLNGPAAVDDNEPDDAELDSIVQQVIKGTTRSVFKILFGVCIGILLICLLIFVFNRSQRLKKTDLPSISVSSTVSTVSAENNPEEIIEAPDTVEEQSPAYNITLTANNKITAREFNRAIELVEARLKILTGDDYTFSVEGEQIFITLKKEYCGYNTAKDTLMLYISRPCQLTVFDANSHYTKYLELSASDIVSTSIENGSIDGLSIVEDGIEVTNYDYLKLEFTDKVADRLSTYAKDWDFCVGQDISYTEYAEFDLFSFSSDYKTLCIYDNEYAVLPSLQLYEYNYTHNSFSEELTVSVEPLVEWEVPTKLDDPGKYQKPADEITGDRVILTYETYMEEVRKGEWIDTLNAVRNRLDVLETPYAIGYGEANNSIAVMINIDRFANAMADNLIENTLCFNIFSSVNYESIYYGELSIGKVTGSPDKIEVSYEINTDYQDSQITDFIKSFIKSDKDLGVKYDTYDIELDSWKYENRILSFVTDADNEYLIRFFDSLQQYDVPVYYTREEEYFISDEGKSLSSLNYGFNHREQMAAVYDRVLQIVPNASVSINDSDILIRLGCNVDEDLPATSLEAAKQIYEAIDFENCHWNNLNFILVDEVDNERCRIFFSKIIGDVDSPGYIMYYGLSANGRIEKYKDQFQPILKTDSFYKNFGFSFWKTDMN